MATGPTGGGVPRVHGHDGVVCTTKATPITTVETGGTGNRFPFPRFLDDPIVNHVRKFEKVRQYIDITTVRDLLKEGSMPERDGGLYTWAAADGRAMLRALREAAGLTQMELAGRLSDAGIGTDQAHIQKIESGTIKRPTAPTLDAILTIGLHVPYRIRIDVLAAFGYRLRWELPAEEEVELELKLNADELSRTIWPSYLVDYAQRILGWNRLFPRLLGNTADDPANAGYVGVTVLDILFNPAIGTNRQIANATSFAPIIVAWTKMMTKPYRQESWFRDFMTRARTWPGFFEMWDQIPEGPDVLLVEHSAVPVEIHVPGLASPLLFRPVHAAVALDPRFGILHLIPLNVETQAVCAAWAAEDIVK
jgi:transcriptional regulator with XRE-family HTH domain